MDYFRTQYEKCYEGEEYYWGLEPAAFLDDLLKTAEKTPADLKAALENAMAHFDNSKTEEAVKAQHERYVSLANDFAEIFNEDREARLFSAP